MKSPAIGAPTPRLTNAMKAALGLLLQAHDVSASLNKDKWDFAIEIQAMEDVGVNCNDLRSLVCQGLADHLSECTRAGGKRRRFHEPRSLRIQEESCFTLSAAGLLIAREIRNDDNQVQSEGWHFSTLGSAPLVLPFWDSERRELRVGEIVAKRFRRPAKNQETILSAFQEDGWPARIDDPLPGTVRTLAVDRLHDVVKKLNHQKTQVIEFRSDGAGLGVIWAFRKLIAQGST